MPGLHSALLFAAALAAAFAAGSKKLVLLTWSRDDHLLLVLSICCALLLAAVLLAAGFFVRFDRSVALLVEVNCVKWGKGGYDLLDVHAERSLYAFQVGSVRYVGGTDGLIVPHSIAPETAKRQARVVIELKRRSTEGLGSALAQAVAELVAASGASAHPCLLFLTDGTECDVFCLGCDCVTHWPRRTLAQGLTHLARTLNAAVPSRVHRSEGVRCEDPALTRTIAHGSFSALLALSLSPARAQAAPEPLAPALLAMQSFFQLPIGPKGLVIRDTLKQLQGQRQERGIRRATVGGQP